MIESGCGWWYNLQAESPIKHRLASTKLFGKARDTTPDSHIAFKGCGKGAIKAYMQINPYKFAPSALVKVVVHLLPAPHTRASCHSHMSTRRVVPVGLAPSQI